MTPALEIVGLGHRFGLSEATFSIGPGEFVVLLGLNGAGKTTLFSLIARLYAHRRGEIRVFGKPLSEDPRAALAQTGFVFQAPTLDLDLTLEQNLLYHAALHGIHRADARARARRELERVGLADRAGERARRLSSGQRRRVELARALLHEPRLLLLDEPTVGLDVAARKFLLDHVRGLCRERNIAALWATHLLDEVGERVLLLEKGRVVGDGPASLAARLAA